MKFIRGIFFRGENMGIIKNLKEEVRIIKERDPAIHSSMEVLLYPSFKVMLHYRPVSYTHLTLPTICSV